MEQKLSRKYLIGMLFMICAGITTNAQEVTVRAGFLSDSVRIGDEVRFFLTARYPRQSQILFPDTLFDYSPFEFRKKKYFPTHTTNGTSYDSVVYYLNTFEVDAIQVLELPVFQLNEQDCTRYYSNRDTLLLQQVVRSLPDSLTRDLPVRATIAYQYVNKQINFPLILIAVALLLMVALLVWFLFGSAIQRYLQLKRMRKAHRDFIAVFNRQAASLGTAFSSHTTETALSTWKKYMEQLNGKPYTKLTTRETVSAEKDETLGRTLRNLDAAIYGSNTEVTNALEQLKAFAEKRFAKKMEEVKHG